MKTRIYATILVFLVAAFVSFNAFSATFQAQITNYQPTWIHLFSGKKAGGIYKYTSKALLTTPATHSVKLPLLKDEMIYIEFSEIGAAMSVARAKFCSGFACFTAKEAGLFFNSVTKFDFDTQEFRVEGSSGATTKLFITLDAAKLTLFEALNGVVGGLVVGVAFFFVFPFLARFFAGGAEFLRQSVVGLYTTNGFKFAFFTSFVFFLIGVAGIILADVYFIDDANRAVQMRDFWANGEANRMGRWGFTILHNLLSLFHNFVDLAPLTHILSCAVLGLSATILQYAIRRKFDLLGVLATLPLGLFPFFMENLSYKFDGVVMCCAIFFAILPFLFRGNLRLFCLVSFFSLFAMYSCYQAAGGLYIALAVFFVIFELSFSTSSNAFLFASKFAISAAASFIAATLCYKLAAPEVTDYVDNSLLPLPQLLTLGHSWRYLSLVFEYGSALPTLYLSGVVMVLFAVSFVLLSPKKLLATLCVVGFLLVCATLFMGGYIFISNTLFAPRVFVSLGGIVAIWASFTLFAFTRFKAFGAVANLFVGLLALSVISFANAYGNALKKQDEWMKFRLEMALKDLHDFVSVSHRASVVIDGDVGFARSVRYFLDSYGKLGENIFTHRLNNPDSTNTYWTPNIYNSQFQYGLKSSGCFGKSVTQLEAGEVLRDGFYHKLTRLGSCYYIKFRKLY